MVRKLRMGIMMCLLVCVTTACSTHIHTVGNGGSGSSVTAERQWYVLWGLVPINKVDSKAMAGGATNYTVKTEQSFIDGLISIVTSFVTVSARTVEVSK
jgi:hypothetical protein